jgi:uncharacterized protein
MGRPAEIFLDVETDGFRSRALTVVGFMSSSTGLVQLVGAEVGRLARRLPSRGYLYTFNGHCFDLACISAQLGLDLRARFESRDLRWICRRRGLTGGQKEIEARIGFDRPAEIDGLGGLDTVRLWHRWSARKDTGALDLLLRYNAGDLAGLAAIKRHVAERGWLDDA